MALVKPVSGILPPGVKVNQLTPHEDDRGIFVEIFRASWAGKEQPIQWNVVKSNANVVRGVHVHKKHADFLTIVSGHMLLALHDFRPQSTYYRQSCTLELGDCSPLLVEVPVGVGHGFYFKKPSIHVYGVSRYFNPSDEFGCMWNDELLGIDWPCSDPKLSEKDKNAMTYSELLTLVSSWEFA